MAINIYYDKDCDLSIIQGRKDQTNLKQTKR